MKPSEVAMAFVACINAHDVDGLCELMTEDHVFLDALDGRGEGREPIRTGWKQYYSMVPDYWIKVDTIFEKSETVAMFGSASGTYAGNLPQGQSGQWEIPAAWLAEIRDGRVAMWRVYADNLPMRRLMGLERE
jgi:ketosteroid isomerase-like protein